MFRVGDDLAVRLPKRAVAAVLIVREQTFLPRLRHRLPLPIPAPLRVGRPQEDYPWSWSVQAWMPGAPVDLNPVAADQGAVLGGFFAALHQPADADAPRNPYRGVALATRRAVIETRMDALAAQGRPLGAQLMQVWREALAQPMEHETWLHGDPHSRNVLAQGGRFSAVIDWGDCCVGDPASDLSALWMLLETPAVRADAIAAYGGLSDTMLARAKGWAIAMGVMLLEAGLVNDPRLAAAGEATLGRLADGP